MSSIDFRECLNAVSDVVINRPRAAREFDQIFMKTADMLLQSEHVAKWFDARRVVFIGDGDAIGLCLVHLHNQKLLRQGPRSVHVLDFDQRIVHSIRRFAARFEIADRVTASLYNVVDPLPVEYWQKFDGFYTNPPFGASNEGKSVEAFLQRGFEATNADAIGCVVVADHPHYMWTRAVLGTTQRLALDNGFIIAEMLPEFHHYHLDDAPDLTSCSLVLRRTGELIKDYASVNLSPEAVHNFYGNEAPLRAQYIIDLTFGGKLPSRDHKVVPLGEKEKSE